ncbi:hypothetical protein CERZMDRAFT_102699 [Cercospora zeae-maydis SCOH1-5]|uniref:AB hydrolase-1 domain-containing protein n=1 Tax=Cercospora zeae-maydis SCOH1-5 TaxID=717836 RepID=A0A6A6F1P0_9PEZI|nr:hypothetical protein CERZMDRAFT_102699 [Cercospora zeae-maydis SCOH1-5]
MSSVPTLIFIAGSWHQGKCFERFTYPLQADYDLTCKALTLPSAQASQNQIIAHSFDGMVGNSAIKGLTKAPNSSPKGQPERSLVIGLILIASGFILTGLTFMAPFFDQPPPSWRINRATSFADLAQAPLERFYHDLEASDAEYWVSQLGCQSLKALFEGGEIAYAGWRDLDQVWYLRTVEDMGLPVWAQRVQVGMARAMMRGKVVHRELRSSHSPFLSLPRECVGLVVEAVEVFMGEKLTTKGEIEKKWLQGRHG